MFLLNPGDSTHIKIAKEVTSDLAKKLKMEQSMLELWYDKISLSLTELLTNSYKKQSILQHARARAYRDIIKRILVNPKRTLLINKDDEQILADGLDDILETVNNVLDESVSPAEIGVFCQIAESGRELFRSRKINPDRFAKNDIYQLALKIRSNYAAYEDTLRGLQV
jgi:hypothetical protein